MKSSQVGAAFTFEGRKYKVTRICNGNPTVPCMGSHYIAVSGTHEWHVSDYTITYLSKNGKP